MLEKKTLLRLNQTGNSTELVRTLAELWICSFSENLRKTDWENVHLSCSTQEK